jgi:hypothetical protein
VPEHNRIYESADARNQIEPWRCQYNAEWPHSSLAYQTPDEFAKTCLGLTSGMGANPPARPSESGNGTAVLAVKGTLSPRPVGPALDRSAPLRIEDSATGGSGGMATG